MRAAAALLLVCALALGACDDLLVNDRTLTIEATGVVRGSTFLDVDGSGTAGAADRPVAGIRVRVVPAAGGGAVAEATTDADGAFRMSAVPVGNVRFVVDSATVPDSVRIFGLDTDSFILAAGDTVARDFRLSFPTYTLAEVRDLPPGRRVFTHGVALNFRLPFGDGAVHLWEGSDYLRATGVERSDLAPRDSVRFLGRTATEAGHPVLDDVRVFVLQTQAVPPLVPLPLTSGEAATADEGSLDAALVRIQDAPITDTVTVNGDLVVTADDGTAPVEVVIRDFLRGPDIDESALAPGAATLARADGLLVPWIGSGGAVRWRLTPRAVADLVVVAGGGGG